MIVFYRCFKTFNSTRTGIMMLRVQDNKPGMVTTYRKITKSYKTPCPIMALATFIKPAILAPFM